MRKLNWKNIGIFFLVLMLLFFLVYVIVTVTKQREQKYCTGISVSIKDSASVQFIKTEDIRRALDRHRIELIKQPVNKLNVQGIEELLEQNPFVKNIECYVTPSGIFTIDVWQREPIFRVSAATNYYVDIAGQVIPTSDAFVPFVHVVSGNVNKEFAVSELKDFVLYLRNNPFWNAQIAQIVVDANNELILIPRIGEHEIEFGTLEEYKLKLAKLKKFYLQGLNTIGWEQYKKISLKYKNQVVCTKK